MNRSPRIPQGPPTTPSTIALSGARMRKAKELLPPVTVLDNSYGLSFWRTGMHFNFRKVYHTLLRLKKKDFWPGVLSDLPPDSRYLVLQFHEARHGDRFSDVDWEEGQIGQLGSALRLHAGAAADRPYNRGLVGTRPNR